MSSHDELEELNSKLNIAWDEVMSQGTYATSTNYQKVEVLLLFHDDEQDDLRVKPEIDELSKVFEEEYHFGVECKPIKKEQNFEKRSQAQVNAIVAQWAYEKDGPHTLLIVYFAGHGTPSENGELRLTGRNVTPNDIDINYNEIVWDNTEKNLHYLIADVLQIFDCCFAGAFPKTCHNYSQTIEFLAACDKDETTPSPGKESFTSALVWALKAFKVKGGRFSVSDLVNKIKEHRLCFENKNTPAAHRLAVKRDRRRILLHPLEKTKAVPEKGATTTKIPLPSAEKEYIMKLEFAFQGQPNEWIVRRLGEELNKIVLVHDLALSRIQWGSISAGVFLTAARKFQQLGHTIRKRPREVTTEVFQEPAMKRLAEGVRDVIHEEVDEAVHEEQFQEELLAEIIQRRDTKEHMVVLEQPPARP